MREDLARLEKELAQIERAITEQEALRGAPEVDSRLAELREKKAELVRAIVAIGGNVSDSNIIVGNQNRAVRSETNIERVEGDLYIQHSARASDDAPYTKDDLALYLDAVTSECDTIHLPYAQHGEATLPLEHIYVALRADRSSPVERRASNKLFRQLVREREAQAGVEESVIYQIAALNPYAARYLLYDESRTELLRTEEEEERTYHLAEIVRTHRWLVLLGHPGSGKSTLARWLALQLAQSVKDGQAEVTVQADHVRPDGNPDDEEPLGIARLPVLVRIADYAAARWQEGVDNHFPLRNYLGRHINQLLEQPERKAALYALLDDYLAQGRVSFILDGLDEVTDAQQRNLIVAQIEDLIRDHICDAQGKNPLNNRLHAAEPASLLTGNQLIVTSRIVGYQLRPLHENLPHFVIQPMDETAVRRFCDNWVAASPNLNLARQLEVEGKALAKAVLEHSNPYVKEQMGRNPLLLTILAQVFSANPEEGLPARRTQLYRQAKEAVFKQRPNQWGRLAQKMGGDDLERALERITAYVAFQLHANPTYPNSLVDERQARRWLQAALKHEPALKGERRLKDVATDLLQAAANLSGFFVARGEGVYGFLHRQFQEYFAALWLVEQGEEDDWEPFFERFANPNWQEVLFLTVGSLAQEDEREATALLTDILSNTHLDPTNGLLPHNALFVATAMREGETWPKSLVKPVATALIQAYQRDDEARFETVKKHVQRAFTTLPRPRRGADGVGEVLVAALGKTGQASVYTRLAATELILECEWHTEAVAHTLSQAWQCNYEPAGTMLWALQKLYHTNQMLFLEPTKGLRGKLSPHWKTIEAHNHWQAVIKALYLAPRAEFKQEAIIRDSPLTDDLLSLLQNAPEKEAELVTLLQAHLSNESANKVARRDAGLALLYLGESRIVPAFLADNYDTYPYQEAIILAFISAWTQQDAGGFILTLLLAYARGDARALADARTRAFTFLRVVADVGGWADTRTFARGYLDVFTNLAALVQAEGPSALAEVNRLAEARMRTFTDKLKDGNILAVMPALADIGGLMNTLKDALADPSILAHPEAHASGQMKWLKDIKNVAISQELSKKTLMGLASLLSDSQVLQQQFQSTKGLEKVWKALAQALQEKAISLSDWFSEVGLALNEELLEKIARVLRKEDELKDLFKGQVLSLETLLPRLNSRALKRRSDDAKERMQRQLRSWLQADGPLIARHGALLLAESDSITPESLPLLCDCLEDSNDVTRYRAQQAINQKRLASQLGRETIELMARLYASFAAKRTAHSMSATYLDWALKQIEHDQAEWLEAWVEAGETVILGRVRRLSQESWPIWLHLLTTARPMVQKELLEATSWLLRLSPDAPDERNYKKNHLSDDQITQLLPVLMELSEASDEVVRLATIAALAHLPRPNSDIIRHLLTLQAKNKGLSSQDIYDQALALAARSKDSELRHEVQAALLPTSSDKSYVALVRLIVTIAMEKEKEGLNSWLTPEIEAKTNSALLNQLRQWLPDDEVLLQALLTIGTDDDGWGGYHHRLVRLTCDLVQYSQDKLLDSLLKPLQTVLDREEWPAKRIALATVEACAEAMGDALNINSTLPNKKLETLLVKGAKEASSHDSRRSAITALSHLRMVTPVVMDALLDAVRDVRIVQEDAIKAVGNFQRLSQAFASDEALASLTQALKGESLTTAYLAAQLLAALGRSPAALGIENLRPRIVNILSDALRHSNAKLEVYVLGWYWWEDRIESRGTLAQTLYQALAQVVALPE